ncbi:MAG: enoyl-CoA hydratase-related protein [Hydrogenophaga sp.]|uniref:enoyl-CoA hydratase-related protein n=1 Tax=Hydrogenophaga sp. TaxID=1904254 RepID=UPI002ABCAAB2|nr:enoyl-CoA hydratase-related protein [Hydrogenophaga sp.]MDZ4281121.1 enoyl-CoA hydratase-related protein [Hydrogenophaga sp.]
MRDAPATIDMAEQSRAALDVVRTCPVPVLAYLNGDVIGGGVELALACDMRIQASHARIGPPRLPRSSTRPWSSSSQRTVRNPGH